MTFSHLQSLDLNMCPPPRSKGALSRRADVSSEGHNKGIAAEGGHGRPLIPDKQKVEVG